MTLVLHRGVDTAVLADGLAGLLAEPLADPFAEEVVVVPARGVERWLTQRLSHRLGAGARGGDGVCAGVRFLTPPSLVALLLGRERDDPWDPERLAWTVLQVIDASLGEPWCITLSQHLGHGQTGEDAELRQGRRWSVARRLAGLFSSYAVQRPTLIADWRSGQIGENRGGDPVGARPGGAQRVGDGLGGQLDEDLHWQAELWRRVVDAVGEPPPDQRLRDTIARLRSGEGDGQDEGLDLPGRLSLFGHTRMPASEVALLEALGQCRDVHLWLPQASPALWDRLAPTAAAGPVPRTQDRSAELVQHRLLAALGRDAREVQRVLATAPSARDATTPATPATPATPHTLLGWLQDDIRHDRALDADTRAARVLDPGDRSLQVHACHGPGRQVEVLREVLSGLLADDPSLEPRDILVMCPDIDDYAPLVHAGFGLADVVDDSAGAGHPAHRLRVRLADRGARHTNPLLAMAAELVRLAGSRVSATEVLDLAHTAPVRWRFGLDDDELDRMTGWVHESAIRWGLDAEHRGSYNLQRFGQNTWAFGLDRVLTGVAVDGSSVTGLGTALAVDDVDSDDIDLVGRLAELVDRLRTTLVALGAAHTGPDWADALRTGVISLADVPPRDRWQLAQLERELERIKEASTQAASPGASVLRLSDVAAVLEDRLGGRPTRANFRTGTLTVCTMVPMRSVPHRVVALVGLDDGVFPRNTALDGDDVLARTPVTGERDPRSEDRQLLLDAVMAAQETLVVTYTGADELTGAERPPAVPLGELIDAARATATFSGHPSGDFGPVGADAPVLHHPLQPFDRRNLRPGALVPGSAEPFSFDATVLAGAHAAAGTRRPVAVVGDHPLPPLELQTVPLQDLHHFLAHPARFFLSQRLGVLLPEVPEEEGHGIPIDLDGLATWGVGDRVLRNVLTGRPLEVCRDAELARGLLPPGALGRRVLDEVCEIVQTLAHAAAPLREGEPGSVDVDVDLGQGRHLVGTVPGLVADRAVHVGYSTVRGTQRLASWLTVLTLTAAYPDTPWTSHVLGRHRSRKQVQVTHGPVEPALARATLRDLVDLHHRGLREPLPVPVETGLAYAEALADHEDPLQKARRAWESDDREGAFPGEQDDPAHVRVHGWQAPLAVLTTPARDDESWVRGERTRLGQLARRVWDPVLTGPESWEIL